MTTIIARPRGRPRGFDIDEAVATAQRLFRARGYDAVGVADLTQALGIKPPSFYAAFGSKAGLFARILARYSEADGLPLADLLRADRPAADCLAALLEEAAHRYAADPKAAGCLVMEGVRCNDHEARESALAFNSVAEDRIRSFIAERHPHDAERLTDFVMTVLAGLSNKARCGHGPDRLLATARLAGRAIAQALPA